MKSTISSKKTIKVEEIKKKVNELLATYTDFNNDDYFLGQRQLLESILMSTGNYQGYQFLGINEVPHGQRPGCHFEWLGREDRYQTACNGTMVDMAFVDTDSNRVRYY